MAAFVVHCLADGGFVRSFGRVSHGLLAFSIRHETCTEGVYRVSVWRLEDDSLIRRGSGSGDGQFNWPVLWRDGSQ
jgi:hypothetical protein